MSSDCVNSDCVKSDSANSACVNSDCVNSERGCGDPPRQAWLALFMATTSGCVSSDCMKNKCMNSDRCMKQGKGPGQEGLTSPSWLALFMATTSWATSFRPLKKKKRKRFKHGQRKKERGRLKQGSVNPWRPVRQGEGPQGRASEGGQRATGNWQLTIPSWETPGGDTKAPIRTL